MKRMLCFVFTFIKDLHYFSVILVLEQGNVYPSSKGRALRGTVCHWCFARPNRFAVVLLGFAEVPPELCTVTGSRAIRVCCSVLVRFPLDT